VTVHANLNSDGSGMLTIDGVDLSRLIPKYCLSITEAINGEALITATFVVDEGWITFNGKQLFTAKIDKGCGGMDGVEIG
jgi:hypothetical protein